MKSVLIVYSSDRRWTEYDHQETGRYFQAAEASFAQAGRQCARLDLCGDISRVLAYSPREWSILNYVDDPPYDTDYPDFEPVPIELPLLMLCEVYGYTVSGQNAFAWATTAIKSRMKRMVSDWGIQTPAWMTLNHPDDLRDWGLYPCIVKSDYLHGSTGLSDHNICNSYRELSERIGPLWKELRSKLIVERYIEGREFRAYTFDRRQFPVMELLLGKERIASYEYKFRSDFNFTASEPDLPLYSRVRAVSLLLEQVCQLTGMVSYDFRLDNTGQLHLIDVNGNVNMDFEYDDERAIVMAAGIDPVRYPLALIEESERRSRSLLS